MVNHGDVRIEKPRSTVFLLFVLCSHTRRARLKAALHRMVSVWHQRAIREQMDQMLLNGSRGTLMWNTDHSVQRRFKSNAPTDWISQHCLVFTWPSKRISLRTAVWTVIRADKRSVWHDSNESCGFVPLLVHKHYIEHLSNSSYRFVEEKYIAIIIIIELLPSPNTKAFCCCFNRN